jgi:hypothetical protein
MAQTRRRRRSKHRGTPAGTIEARGRTGRKPRPEERSSGDGAGRARGNRFDQPPTWKSATQRAGVAAGIFLVAVIAIFRQNIPAAVSISALMFALYIPMSYYTDAWLYRRRLRQKADGKAPSGKGP